MLLQRFGAVFSNISGSKMPIWKQNSMPQANNMDAKHCAGQTQTSIFNEKGIWRANLMGFHAKTMTLGSIYAGITL
jgi:hypothetical protein